MTEYTDTDRINWLAFRAKTSTVYMDGQHPWSFANYKLHHLRGPTFRDAVDAAMKADHWKPAASEADSDGVLGTPADQLREDTRQHGHCPECRALHPQHHAGCTRGVAIPRGGEQ